MIRHVVMYKFLDHLTSAQVQEVIDAFCQLPKQVPNVIDFEWGTNVSPEGKDEGFTHCFLVTFPDETARDAYIVHPAHQEFVALVRPRREKVIVFDYVQPGESAS